MSDSRDNSGAHPEIPPAPIAPAPQYQAATSPYPTTSPYPSSSPHPTAPQHPVAPYQYATAQPYAQSRPTSGLAVTSLVAGAIGILLSWTLIALVASIVAVITGHMGMKATRPGTGASGRGMAIAGLILGYIGVAILVLTLGIVVLSFLFIGGVSVLPAIFA